MVSRPELAAPRNKRKPTPTILDRSGGSGGVGRLMLLLVYDFF